VAYTEDGKTFSGMGTVFADIDDDGLPDILTTALPYEYYALFHNAGKGQFQYASVTSGLAKATRPYGGWGIRAFDYDNDGNKELFVANAHVMDNIEVTQPHLRSIQPPLLLGYKGGKFVDISGSAGDAFKQPWAARGAAFGDLDNDGDIDVVVTDYNAPAHLLRNEGGNRNHWIALNLRGTKSNRSAIGAKVRLTSNSGTVQHAMVSTAGSYLSANDSRLFFGLGQDREIREIYIQWPSGLEQTITGAKSDEFLTIVETEQRRIQPVTPAPANSARAQQMLDTGLAMVKQGKTAEALAAFRDALKLDTDLTEAHFALGVLLARQGKQNYGEAMDHFLQVIRRNPSDVDAHVNLSNLLEEGGDLGAAVAEMNKAVSLAPGNAQLYVILGQKQQKLRDNEGAANSFRRALDSGRPLPQAHYGLGMTLKASRNWEEAARQFQAALALNPADAHAHWQLGVVRAEQQQFAEAAAHLEQSVRLNPQIADAWFELGKVCRRQGRTSDAEAAFRKGLELKPDRVDALYALAKISKDADESSKLQGSIRELKAQSAESARAVGLNGEGLGLMDRGDIDGALAKFREALKVDPSFSVAAYNTGVALAHKGDTRGALDALRNAINLQPGFGAAHFALGILLKASGDPNADEELRTAKMLNELAANPKEKAGPR
jgi:tetratricopeptide (TPR) repeat protein